MAGGQERILKRRIRTSSRRRRSRARWSSSPRAGSSRRSARVQAARPVQRPDHRGRSTTSPQGGAGVEQPAAQAARRDPQGRVRRGHRRPRPVRRVQLVGHPPGRAARSKEQAGARPRLLAGPRRQEGRGLLPLPQLPHRRVVHRLERPADLRGRPRRSAAAVDSRRSRPATSTRSQLVYTRFVVGRHPGGRRGRPLMPLDPGGLGSGRPTADADDEPPTAPSARLRVRARRRTRSSTRCCRATSRPASSPRCSTPPRRSTRPASGR